MSRRQRKEKARLAARRKAYDALSSSELDSLRARGLKMHRPGSLNGRK